MVSLKIVILFVSLPLRRPMLSCLTFRSSFCWVMCFQISSCCMLVYFGILQISVSLHSSHTVCCCNRTFFVVSIRCFNFEDTVNASKLFVQAQEFTLRQGIVELLASFELCNAILCVFFAAFSISSKNSASLTFTMLGANSNSHSASFSFTASS